MEILELKALLKNTCVIPVRFVQNDVNFGFSLGLQNLWKSSL